MLGPGRDRNQRAREEIANAEARQFEKVDWKRDPGLRKLYFLAVVLWVASIITGYDGSLLNTSQTMNAWQTNFHTPKGSKLGLMNAIYQIGNLCSLPFVPYIADGWGRRRAIVCGCLIMVLGGFLGAFSKNYGMYIAGRLIVGMGNGISEICSPILLTEICHPQHRVKVTTIYNCLYYLGTVVVSWLALATSKIDNNWSWRSLTLLQIFPAVIQLTFIYWVPESPRWLISKEHYDKALNTLAHFHANGDTSDFTVQFEFNEIRETIRLELEHKKRTSYLDFFRTKGNRYRLMLILAVSAIVQYSGSGLFSNYSNLIYESAGIVHEDQKIFLNGGSSLLYLLVAISCSLLVNRFRRRRLFLVATIGMDLMFMAWTIVGSQFEKTHDVKSSGYPQIVFIWLFNVSYAIAWNGLSVTYCLEILPFKLRAKGMAIKAISGMAFLVLGNYTNPIAWERLPHQYDLSVFYTCWIFLEVLFIYFFFVETKGPDLEEIAKIFDGGDAEVADNDEIEKRINADSVHVESAPNEASGRPVEDEVALGGE